MQSSGHFHIVVDTGDTFWPEGTTMPNDPTHIHYGDGQTDANLILSPGQHTLLLQMCNSDHQSYGEAFASYVTITVLEPSS